MTKNYEQNLLQEKHISRNVTSDIILHFSCGWAFGTRRNEWCRKM